MKNIKCDTIMWELTHACNLNCLHCVGSPHTKRKDELTFKEKVALLPQIKELGTKCISFSDGEPLLYPQFLEFSKTVSRYGFTLGVISNGTLFNDYIINEMYKIGFNVVGISIDGPEKIHNHIRRNNEVFHKAITAVKKLKEKEIKVAISTCVNGVTINYLDELAEILNGLNIDVWQLMTLIKQNQIRHKELLCSDETWERLDDFIIKIHENKKNNFCIKVMNCLGTLRKYKRTGKFHQPCLAGKTFFGITSNGLIKGCLAQPDEYAIASVRGKKLKEIWENLLDFKAARTSDKKNAKEYYKGYCNTIV